MAPHLTPAELDSIASLSSRGKSPQEAHAKIQRGRMRRGVDTPTVNNVRLAMQGKTHRRGAQERRGRKLKITPKKFRAMQRARKDLQKSAAGAREVPMAAILRRARVKVDPSNARKYWAKREG